MMNTTISQNIAAPYKPLPSKAYCIFQASHTALKILPHVKECVHMHYADANRLITEAVYM